MINKKKIKVCLVTISLLCCIFLINIISASVPPSDLDPPITTILYDPETGIVTFIAYDLPYNSASGVFETYYNIDDEITITYSGPFNFPEGTHSITYWSEDRAGNDENPKTATYVWDTTPPSVEFVTPEQGKIYLFGTLVMDRLIWEKTFLIGKLQIEVEADDSDGTGVSMVLLKIGDDSAFDVEPPYTYEFTNLNFGEITISVKAIDHKGLVSDSIEMKVVVYSLGLLK